MKKLISIEELALTAASIYLLTLLNLPFSWWVYVLLFFAPDISILGYVAGNVVGAVCYNLFHHRGIAILVAFIGLWLQNDYIIFSGLILFSHSSFDRILGYGLKHFEGFKHTHLGKIG